MMNTYIQLKVDCIQYIFAILMFNELNVLGTCKLRKCILGANNDELIHPNKS
jgi:hypothetical protein